MTENPPAQIYVNKIKNRIVFKIETGYKLELLTPEKMNMLGSTKKDVDNDKDGENVPKLESVEVVSNKQFGQLTNISPHSFTMMNIVNTAFSSVEAWLADQTSKAFKIKHNVNLTLIIGLTL